MTVDHGPQRIRTPVIFAILLGGLGFVVIAYLMFALAYDRAYVFPRHEAKYQQLMLLVEAETKRSAEDLDGKGSTGPNEVAALMGFPSDGLKDGGHDQHERYTFRRGLPWMTRIVEVYYKGPKDNPYIYSVAHAEDEIEEARPGLPIIPTELPDLTQFDELE